MFKRVVGSFGGVNLELRDKKCIVGMVFIWFLCLCVGVLGWVRFSGYFGLMWVCFYICGLVEIWMT